MAICNLLNTDLIILCSSFIVYTITSQRKSNKLESGKLKRFVVSKNKLKPNVPDIYNGMFRVVICVRILTCNYLK